MKILLIDICEIFVNNIGYFIASGSMLIAALALKVTNKSFKEQNRPYVTFYIEGELQPGLIYFYIRNTGIRGAEDVKINISPTPKSYALKERPEHSDKSLFEFSFIAPNQMIRTFFDHGLYRYQKGLKPENDKFNINLTYKYRGKGYFEKYDIDISYLSYICDASTPSDIKKGFIELHNDLCALTKAVQQLGKKEDV